MGPSARQAIRTNGYVAQFAPAISNDSVYIPERFGRLNRVALSNGALQAQINPFADTPFNGDERVIVNNAVSAAPDGTIYYTVVAWPLGTPGPALRGVQPRGSWIVQVRPDNTFRLVDFPALAAAAGLPGLTSLCEYPFGTGGTPLPTGPTSRPPQFGCGTQRPAINAPITIDESSGNLIVYSYANNAQGAAFLTEVDPTTMTPIRTFDTRGHAMHGCGVRLPITPGGRCALLTANGTTNIGVDPNFNGPVRVTGPDIMDNAPAVSVTGAKFIGSYDGGFTFGGGYDARSFGVVFHPGGAIATQEEFYWEVTPSILQQGAELTVLQDRNLYSDFELTVARYDQSFNLEETHTIDLDLEPVAIDFVDAHIPFGPRGDTYHLNGDGHLYKFVPGVEGPVEAVEFKNANGSTRSMSTLSNYFARDRAGRIYASFAGSVYVIASSDVGIAARAVGVTRALSARPAAGAKLADNLQAKRAALSRVTAPETP